MDAINVDEYFADRVLAGTKVTLKADITKQLPVSSGTKNITVIIPVILVMYTKMEARM